MVARRERWYQKITVEPSMFLYMMAFMLTSVVEQVFFLYKACTVNHGYSHDVCINIEQYQDIKKEVQITTSTFHMWNNVAMYVVPIVLALFLGAWSDRRGRKLPLILGLIGKFIYSVMIVVNTRMTNWPVEYIIYTATIPSVLTGADIAIFASCFAYISDITSVQDRTIRITILDATYLSTMPIGVAIGTLIYNRTAKSFTIMFAINASLLLASIVYSAFRLKSRTTDRQVSIRELRWYRMPADFFDRNHVVHSLQTFFKKRTMNRRVYLYILMIAMSFYTFQRDEKPKMYLYTQLKFNWDADKYSYFKTYQSAAYVIMMFLGVPLFTKVLGMRDTVSHSLLPQKKPVTLQPTLKLPVHHHDRRHRARLGPLRLHLRPGRLAAVRGGDHLQPGPRRRARATLDDLQDGAGQRARNHLLLSVRV